MSATIAREQLQRLQVLHPKDAKQLAQTLEDEARRGTTEQPLALDDDASIRAKLGALGRAI